MIGASYCHNTNGHLTKVTTPNGRENEFGVHGVDRRYSRTAGGTTTVFHHAGDKVLLKKQGGSFTGRLHYPDNDVGTGGNARYYDAQVGRFITRDTVLSEHPYLYCEHDAVNWVDPSGHIIPFLIIGGIAVGLTGYSIIRGWFAAEEVSTIVGAGDAMHGRIDDWHPRTDKGADLKSILHVEVTNWVISAGKEPAVDLIGALAAGILGLGTPSVTKAIYRVDTGARPW